MKRLLKISFNSAFFSFIPILSWFVLSLIVDKSLINVFTLTYPLQFIFLMIKSIFATGANISKEKDKNEFSVMSGIVLGIIVGLFIFGYIALNIESYIKFMNMDIQVYKEFAIYSVIQMYIQLVFAFILEKLYFENKEKLAIKYCTTLNILNFIILVITSLIFKDKMIIVILTLLSILIYVIFVCIKEFNKFKFKCNLLKFVKYDSVELFNNVAFFLIFFFGLSNALDYGEQYGLALTFVALITDTQWDSFEAIATVAKIDISKNNFNYIEHRNNAYKLMIILFSTSVLMFILLYQFYNLNFFITCIFFGFEIVHYLIFPIYKIKTCFLQLDYSAFITTANKVISCILRMFISLLPTPFCTGLGQVLTSLYQFFTINIIFKRKFYVNEKGFILKRK